MRAPGAAFLVLLMLPMSCSDGNGAPEADGAAGAVLPLLWDNPNLAPPPVAERRPIVRYVVAIRDGQPAEPTLIGTRNGALEAQRTFMVTPTHVERPDYWVVVYSKHDRAKYWVPVDDPRRLETDHLTNEETGELAGGPVVLNEGLLAVSVPFYEGGRIELRPGGDYLAMTEREPLSTYKLGESPPHPPGVATRVP